MLMFGRNQHDSVKQLFFSFKKSFFLIKRLINVHDEVKKIHINAYIKVECFNGWT